MNIYKYEGNYYKKIKKSRLGNLFKWQRVVRVLGFYVPVGKVIWSDGRKFERVQ